MHYMLPEQQREGGMRGLAGLNSYSWVEGLLIFERLADSLNDMISPYCSAGHDG